MEVRQLFLNYLQQDDGYLYYKDLAKVSEYGTPMLKINLPQHFVKQIVPYAILSAEGNIHRYTFDASGFDLNQYTEVFHPEGDPFQLITNETALTSTCYLSMLTA